MRCCFDTYWIARARSDTLAILPCLAPRLEAASLQPWTSKGAHHEATISDRDSDDEQLDSASYVDACGGPHATGNEFDVRHCGHPDPSDNTAAVVTRRKTTLGELLGELEDVKGALQDLLCKLQKVESYATSSNLESATARQAKGEAEDPSRSTGGLHTAGCGCSWREVVAATAFASFTWRYARASNE